MPPRSSASRVAGRDSSCQCQYHQIPLQHHLVPYPVLSRAIFGHAFGCLKASRNLGITSGYFSYYQKADTAQSKALQISITQGKPPVSLVVTLRIQSKVNATMTADALGQSSFPVVLQSSAICAILELKSL